MVFYGELPMERNTLKISAFKLVKLCIAMRSQCMNTAIKTIALVSIVCLTTACSTGEKRVLTGTAIGAGTGALIGAAAGDAGTGALIGAGVGAAGGYLYHRGKDD